MTENETPVKVITPARVLFRVRVTYAHLEALRYVSHLDMHLVWERTLRRAGVPLAYSQGFTPHPRLHQASALPLGFLSRCEIIDFWLDFPPGSVEPDLDTLVSQVQESAPPGLIIQKAEFVPLSQPALQTQVQAAEYLALPLDPVDLAQLTEAVNGLLAAEQLPRERRGKPYDLRALVEALEIRLDDADQPALVMRLTAREGATGRPEELLSALGHDPAAFRVERTALIMGS